MKTITGPSDSVFYHDTEINLTANAEDAYDGNLSNETWWESSIDRNASKESADENSAEDNDKGHGNEEDGCDLDNPGNSKKCEKETAITGYAERNNITNNPNAASQEEGLIKEENSSNQGGG